MKLRDKIGRFFSDTKTLFGLIVLMVFLPLALFVIPTFNGVSASPSAAIESDDPINNIVLNGDVDIIKEVSTITISEEKPTQTSTNSTNTATTVSSGPVARSSNYLSIPGKVSSTVVPVGLDASGAISVPASAVGMYNHGGAIFLDGHSTGVFSRLSAVRVGEIVEFTLNSITSQYQVVNVVMYTFFDGANFDHSFMYDSLYSGGANGLNMMTCAGAYLPEYGTYSHRLVVYSVKM